MRGIPWGVNGTHRTKANFYFEIYRNLIKLRKDNSSSHTLEQKP